MYFQFSLFNDSVIVWDCAGWHEIRAQALHSVIPVKDVKKMLYSMWPGTFSSWDIRHRPVAQGIYWFKAFSPRSNAHNRCIERSSGNGSVLRVVVWTLFLVNEVLRPTLPIIIRYAHCSLSTPTLMESAYIGQCRYSSWATSLFY
jgi:hypothetical protein